MPYLMEAMPGRGGVAPEAIDQAAVDFGMPMGPVLLADTVGLDVCLSVASILAEPFGVRCPRPPGADWWRKNAWAETGQGFYRFGTAGPRIPGAPTRIPGAPQDSA